jgi:hypothetical protein
VVNFVLSKSADWWCWGSFEGRLGDGHTSALLQVDLHCRRRAVGGL